MSKSWGDASLARLYSCFNTCEQGSAEWHNLRSGSLGGSMSAVAIDKYPYKSKKAYIEEFCSGAAKEYEYTVPTTHGIIMEDLNRQFASMCLGTNIYEAGIHVGNNRCHFSPDGIAFDLQGRCVLAEFKTWYTRRVSQQIKDIPRHYICQVQHSMGQIQSNINSLKTSDDYMIDYCLFQDMNVVYNNDYDMRLNHVRRLSSRSVYGTFRCHFYSDKLPQNIMHDINAIHPGSFLTILNTMVPTGPASIVLTEQGKRHISNVQHALYNKMLDVITPTVEYRRSFSRLPNIILDGSFGHVGTFKIEPDVELIHLLRQGAIDLWREIEDQCNAANAVVQTG